MLSDRYGQATISTTLHEDGRIEAHSESVAAADGSAATLAASVTEESPRTHSQPSTPAGAGPAPAAAAAAAAPAPSQAPDEPAAGDAFCNPENSKTVLPLSPMSGPPAGAVQELPQTSEGSARAVSEHGSGNAEEEEEADALTSPEGNSPSAAEGGPDDFSEGLQDAPQTLDAAQALQDSVICIGAFRYTDQHAAHALWLVYNMCSVDVLCCSTSSQCS